MDYKCGYCNAVYKQPGYCEHGTMKVALKAFREVGSMYQSDLRAKNFKSSAEGKFE